MAEREPINDNDGSGNPYLGLLAVVAGVALLYWLATLFFDWNKTQECVGYGKRNCAPRIELQNQ